MSGTSIRKPGQRYMPLQPDALAYTGIKSPNTFYNMHERGECRLVKIARRTMLDLEDWDARMSDTDRLKPSDLYEFAEMLMHMAQEIDARDSDCPCDECAGMRQRNRPN